MNQLTTKNRDGFTIIEVVLVLAIAALIFLIVFLAVPSLQRSQRDTQRRHDMSRFVSQVQQYQSNNTGAIPDGANIATFVTNYMNVGGDTFADPSVGNYTVTAANAATANSTSTVGTIYYVVNATCDGETVSSGSGARKIAIVTKLEGAGKHCLNN